MVEPAAVLSAGRRLPFIFRVGLPKAGKRRSVRTEARDAVNPWLLFALTISFNSAGTLLLKFAGGDSTRLTVGSFNVSPWVIAALACYGLNFLSFAKLLQRVHVSTAYPIVVGCSFVAITLGGALIFGESISLRHVVGWIAILAGVTVLAGS